MNPFGPFPGFADAQMKARIVSLEARLGNLETQMDLHQIALKKINQLLKDMGAAINRILGRME